MRHLVCALLLAQILAPTAGPGGAAAAALRLPSRLLPSATARDGAGPGSAGDPPGVTFGERGQGDGVGDDASDSRTPLERGVGGGEWCDDECQAKLGPWTPSPPGPPCGTTPGSHHVSISTRRKHRHLVSDCCPGYDWRDQDVPQEAHPQRFEARVPLSPVINARVTPVVGEAKFVLDAIGMALNGVPFFSPADHYGRDALRFEGFTFDHCGGHASFRSQYHYHIVPGDAHCMLHNASRNNDFRYCKEAFWKETAGKHSPLLGFMADGIPIYGPQGDAGLVPQDLDTCNGHTDATLAFYHYHGTSDFPMLVRCLRGCVALSDWPNFVHALSPCEPAPVQYDYSSLASVSVPPLPARPALTRG